MSDDERKATSYTLATDPEILARIERLKSHFAITNTADLIRFALRALERGENLPAIAERVA